MVQSTPPALLHPGTQTQFNSFFNGKDGEISGFELNASGTAEDWLPEPFDGLGASGNVTFIDSSFYAPNLGKKPTPCQAHRTWFTMLRYSMRNLSVSARLNYQYRDAWLSTTENDSLTEYWDATERVDASLRYTLPNPVMGTNVTFALNGNNLTNEKDTRYINSPETPNQYEGFGRRWVAFNPHRLLIPKTNPLGPHHRRCGPDSYLESDYETNDTVHL